ncbi:proline-rich protein PRCC [Megalopta genalis]|uniref:proline-rich protein PRCC n=1 Tax=Megalopta genalis TaxID=115081 RepID=UPI0014434926|nr:proline-rich protein PRCC [Megalopta genalis]
MSLVAYGSSDESSDEEGNKCETGNVNKTTEELVIKQTNDKLCLPAPKHDEIVEEVRENGEKIHFDKLPKPKSLFAEPENVIEDDDIPPKKEEEFKPEKPIKKNRAPVKITVPSLSEFKDVEEEDEARANRIRPSTKGTKLFALLPLPKGAEVKSTNNLIPSVVNKTKIHQNKPLVTKDTKGSIANKVMKVTPMKSSIGIDYESNSEDEDGVPVSGTESGTDFFALSVTDTPVISDALMNELSLKKESNEIDPSLKDDASNEHLPNSSAKTAEASIASQKTLVSNIMNLPKEEILLKNKAEVGPKLPIPEQEYNVDTEGNVAFDEKAIEYLCGKRSIKRKAKEIDESSIIEINGEDIKPDEREWLVKALTEEPVQRPVSMMGGVNSQSKKKHQITYLAHQAKAMEMELKNQWAQNRMTRKQTQSKYGF